MEIILKEDVIGLGYKNDIVNVKPGYGRNYLIPTGKGVIASESAKKELAELLKQKAVKLAKIKAKEESGIAAKNGDKKAEPADVLYLSGFDANSIRFLQDKLPIGSAFQLMPMGMPMVAGEKKTDYHATLKPGSPVGVAIVYGDFAVGATGTVTATDGKRILAFGHPFLHKGNVNYFMTKASIVGTISGQSNGMKLANIGDIIGRINQDRDTGIAGKLGDFPSVVPIKVKVTDKSLNRTQDFAARIAYDEDFLPQISGGIAYAAMSKVSDNLGASTANVKFTIRTNAVKSGKVERSNMFYNTADVGQIAVAEIMQGMNLICSNTDKESDILDIQADITMDSERKTASILSATPDRMKVAPGETVKFTVTIKPYRRDKETLLIPYTVPENQPDGTLNLDVRGGGMVPVTPLMLLQQTTGVAVQSEADKAQTTADKLKALAETGRNNEIIIAPGAAAQPLTEKEQKKVLREAAAAAKRAAAAAKSAPRKVDFLHKAAKAEGQTKFETNYIIDNVAHVTLKVDHTAKA